MIRPLVLVDLDDNLFQTEAKCPPRVRARLVRAATARNGRHSHMTPAQKAFVDWLLASAETVPVTARDTEAYRAVAIPFACGAVVANGAVVLGPDGTPDPGWRAAMAADLVPLADELELLLEQGRMVAGNLGLCVRSWLVEEDGLKVYAVFKENGETDGRGLAGLAAALSMPEGWTVHANGNNLAYLPAPVSKRRAAGHLISQHRAVDPDRPVLGLGDSLSDLAFLSLCDWWGAPRDSQIARGMSSLTGWFEASAQERANAASFGLSVHA